MKLLTEEIRTKLLANGVAGQRDENHDPQPVVKFFGGGACTWLLTELDPDDNDIAFGLCDLGFGSPELGSVRISELASIKFKPFGLGVERDLHFRAKYPISHYADMARNAGRIVLD